MPEIKAKLKKENIKLNYQETRKHIDLSTEFNLLQNDRLLNENLNLNPILYTGQESNFLSHNLLTTYFKQSEYGFKLEKNNLELKVLTTNNQEQDLDLLLRWKQLTPKTDWLFKSKSELNNHDYSDFKTEIKYYHATSNYSLGLGNIDNNNFVYLSSQYNLGPNKKDNSGEIDLVYSKNNNLGTLISQKTSYNFNDKWSIKPKISFNNTKVLPSPLIYRGIDSNENIKLQAGIDLTYNHNFINPIELNILQLTDIRFYAFIDYKDKFDNSYAYGLGNKTNFNLLGLKPIDIESYIAYDKHYHDFKSIIKLNYQF